MPGMDLKQDTRGNVDILSLGGFMDNQAVSRFIQALDELILNGKTKIVLDISRLVYIPSAGLGALVGRIRDLRRQGGDIKIGGHTSRVYELLKILGFLSAFDVSDTVDAAVHKYKR